MTNDEFIKFTNNYFERSYEYLWNKARYPVPTILFFGAGASFGSDNPRLVRKNLLPPLGNNLFKYLVKSRDMVFWKKIPNNVKEIFLKKDFEQGLLYIMENDEELKIFNSLLIELASFFAKFEPRKQSLYFELAKRIRQT